MDIYVKDPNIFLWDIHVKEQHCHLVPNFEKEMAPIQKKATCLKANTNISSDM